MHVCVYVACDINVTLSYDAILNEISVQVMDK